jgi:NhaP-type Na+/H+ or K+/H+ antiporter
MEYSSKIKKNLSMKYVVLFFFLAAVAIAGLVSPSLINYMATMGTHQPVVLTLFTLIVFLSVGWVSNKLAEGTIFPSFSIMLMAGLLLHPALAPCLGNNPDVALVVCTCIVIILVKEGGDFVERAIFTRIALSVVLISTLGCLITFVVLGYLISTLGLLEVKTGWMLAAVLCPTDPAAVVPILKGLVWKQENSHLSDIAIAESASNDAFGAIVAGALSVYYVSVGEVPIESTMILSGLVSQDNLFHLATQLGFGLVAGVVGWYAMYRYEIYQSTRPQETTYDFAIVMVIPLVTYFLAELFHGNGFLAAFICGLLANYNHGNDSFHHTLHTLEVKIDSIGKPIVFMIVGAFVSPMDLWESIVPGLLIASLFIIIVRPIAVFFSLFPVKGMTKNQKWFLCSVRETGVVAMLLSMMMSIRFPEMKAILPITTWVVITTLVILPPLTMRWARRLDLLETEKA